MEKIKIMKDIELHVRVPAGASKEEVLKALTEEVERKMEFESEDEKIRKQIEQAIIEHDWSATYKVSKDDCLAYLEKLKAQKPAEWSEEDKWKLNRIHAILGQAADAHAFSTTCRLIGDKEAIILQDFLRSISKPQITEWERGKCLEGVLDYDDLSQIELAVAAYWEKNWNRYPVTREHQKKVLQKLYSLAGYDYNEFTHEWEDEK